MAREAVSVPQTMPSLTASKRTMTLAGRIWIILLFAGLYVCRAEPGLAFQDQPSNQPTNSQPSESKDQATPNQTGGQSLPAAKGEPAPSATPQTGPPKPAPPKTSSISTTAKPPVKKRTRRTVTTQSQRPKKVVVRNGGASDSRIQISSGDTQQTSQLHKSTDSLLAVTTDNLNKLYGRQLSANQQDMVKQVRTYMQQSKAATDAGDEQGANNLAVKAHLLSEELVKP